MVLFLGEWGRCRRVVTDASQEMGSSVVSHGMLVHSYDYIKFIHVLC
jgi:hypothetical protein